MDEQCRAEVFQLHQFFENWFTAKLDPTDEEFRRFSEVVAEDFEIISPEGRRMTRGEITTSVRSSHGTFKGEDFRIWIDNYRSRPLQEGLQLVTYEEWQEREAQKRGRLSTALFRRKPEAPNTVEWLHVHETWLPSKP